MNFLQKIGQVAVILGFFSATQAIAAPQADGLQTDYLTGYVGYVDVIRNSWNATQFGAEYRAKPIYYGLRPMVGISDTTDGSVYGYAGLNYDIPLWNKQVYLIPNFAAGAYAKGDGKPLGGAIEFRSGLELDYQLKNSQRVGVAFNHISNASIYYHNPGIETVLVSYSIPLGLR